MAKIRLALVVLAATMIVAIGISRATEDKKPKHTIKEVMKEAHKDGLLKKVTEGDSEQADKEKLLELYTSLSENEPTKGEEKSWKEKTEALVKAAKGVVKDEKGAKAKLKKAAECKACHAVHK